MSDNHKVDPIERMIKAILANLAEDDLRLHTQESAPYRTILDEVHDFIDDDRLRGRMVITDTRNPPRNFVVYRSGPRPVLPFRRYGSSINIPEAIRTKQLTYTTVDEAIKITLAEKTASLRKVKHRS